MLFGVEMLSHCRQKVLIATRRVKTKTKRLKKLVDVVIGSTRDRYLLLLCSFVSHFSFLAELFSFHNRSHNSPISFCDALKICARTSDCDRKKITSHKTHFEVEPSTSLMLIKKSFCPRSISIENRFNS